MSLLLFLGVLLFRPTTPTLLRTHPSPQTCSTITSCLLCLENPLCGYCYSNIGGGSDSGILSSTATTNSPQTTNKAMYGSGTCMTITQSGVSSQSCHGGWIVAPLTISKVAQKDEAHTCAVLVKKQTDKPSEAAVREELFVDSELLGLVSRACLPCRGFWPKCDCKGVTLDTRNNVVPTSPSTNAR